MKEEAAKEVANEVAKKEEAANEVAKEDVASRKN